MRYALFAPLLVLVLAACESDFDKCLATEVPRMEEALRMANPVYVAYARVDGHGKKLGEYHRAYHAKRIELDRELGTEDPDCDLEPDSPCTEVFRKRMAAGDAHIRELKLQDVDESLTALYAMQRDLIDFDGWKKIQDAGWKNSGEQPDSDDPEIWKKYELEMYEGQRAYHLGQLDLVKIIEPAREMAAEVCNSRGLYK